MAICPPCASTIRRDSVRPRPEPPGGALGACTNGSKIRGRYAAGMPRPESATEMLTNPWRATAVTVIRPPRSVARIAFVRRFVTTRSIWERSADTVADHLADALRRETRSGLARFDAREVQQFPHQPLEPRDIVAARCQDLTLPGRHVAGSALEQQMDAHLHRGEGRAQFMRG